MCSISKRAREKIGQNTYGRRKTNNKKSEKKNKKKDVVGEALKMDVNTCYEPAVALSCIRNDALISFVDTVDTINEPRYLCVPFKIAMGKSRMDFLLNEIRINAHRQTDFRIYYIVNEQRLHELYLLGSHYCYYILMIIVYFSW